MLEAMGFSAKFCLAYEQADALSGPPGAGLQVLTSIDTHKFRGIFGYRWESDGVYKPFKANLSLLPCMVSLTVQPGTLVKGSDIRAVLEGPCSHMPISHHKISSVLWA